jgi:hypothetical protein
MGKRVQLIRHDAAAAALFEGLPGELTVNLDNDSVHVHTGTSPGGVEQARADLQNVPIATVSEHGKMSSTQVSDLATAVSGISSLDARVTTNEADIASNDSDIATLFSDMTSAQVDILVNAANITTNIGNIATNAADIATLQAEMVTAQADILLRELLANKNAANGYAGLDAGAFLLPAQIPLATEIAVGGLEIATDAEALAKSIGNRTLVPSNLAAMGATVTFAGLIELATAAETLDGGSAIIDRAITPDGLWQNTAEIGTAYTWVLRNVNGRIEGDVFRSNSTRSEANFFAQTLAFGGTCTQIQQDCTASTTYNTALIALLDMDTSATPIEARAIRALTQTTGAGALSDLMGVQALVSSAAGTITNSYGVYGSCVAGTGNFDFYADGAAANYGPFTGSHEGLVLKDFEAELGDIVVDVKVVNKSNISNAICENAQSTQLEQKNVVGVLSAPPGKLSDSHSPAGLTKKFYTKEQLKIREEGINVQKNLDQTLEGLDPVEDKDEIEEIETFRQQVVETLEDTYKYLAIDDYKQIQLKYNLITFNAVGEGLINVVGLNGDIEPGDLICASSIPGKGCRQTNTNVRNFTVAKAREKVTWRTNNKNEVKQIACIYLCG